MERGPRTWEATERRSCWTASVLAESSSSSHLLWLWSTSTLCSIFTCHSKCVPAYARIAYVKLCGVNMDAPALARERGVTGWHLLLLGAILGGLRLMRSCVQRGICI